jgi:hypothetical protein
MKRLMFIFLFASMLANPATIAQQKALSLNDAAGLNPRLYPTGLQQLNWLPETTAFVYKINDAIVSGRKPRYTYQALRSD